MMNSFYLLKKRLLGASLVLANIACSNAATLDVRSAFLSGNSADIPNSSPLSFTPVLSTPALDSGYAGKALVISSFSSEKTNESKAITAHYDLAGPGSGGAISQEHDRELAKITGGGTEAGSGSAAAIVDITAGSSNTFSLRSATSSTNNNDGRVLAGSTVTAIPIGGLDYVYAPVLLPTTNAVTQLTSGSLNIPAVFSGTSELFLMASIDVRATGGTTQGTWALQYQKNGAVTWETAGSSIRTVGASEGIVSVTALADLDAFGAGDYNVRLTHQSGVGGVTLISEKIDFVALSLALDSETYYQSYSTTGSSLDVTVAEGTRVFAGASLSSQLTSGTATGIFGLTLDGSTTLATSTRYVDSTNIGSIGLFGASAPLTAGTHTLGLTATNGLSLDVGGSGSNLVAFALTTSTMSAVPEPTSALAGLLLMAGAFRRRR